MKKILIFCQAPADIKYVLTIYERNINNAEISIFTVNVQGMYEFINSLGLNLKQLEHVSSSKFKLKNPISIIKTKIYLTRKYKQYFANKSNLYIYYFSNLFDYITFSLLKEMYKNNKIFFINHYDDRIINRYSPARKNLLNFFRKLIYYYYVNVWFDLYCLEKSLMIRFPYNKFKIKEQKENILEKNICEQFSIKLKGANKKKILFIERDYKKNDVFIDYEKSTVEIIITIYI